MTMKMMMMKEKCQIGIWSECVGEAGQVVPGRGKKSRISNKNHSFHCKFHEYVIELRR